MANRKITLKDSTGADNLYPATFTSQVFNEDGENVDTLLENLNTLLDNLKVSTVLLDNTALTTTDTQYNLTDSATNYLFIALCVSWGGAPNNFTGVVIIPNFVWQLNGTDVINVNLNNEPTHYALVSRRLSNSIYAKRNDTTAITLKVLGICKIS